MGRRSRFPHLFFAFPQYPQGLLLLVTTALQFVVDVAKQFQDLVAITGIVRQRLFLHVVLGEVKELIGRERSLICREILCGAGEGVPRLK